MHVNIVNFEPGGAIPFPETHVMEHGLYVLEGKAVYLLNQDWVEVEAGDFMWLRAFCPQACYAGGPGRFRYLLYKDVNRHMPLGRQLVCEVECAMRKKFSEILPSSSGRLVESAARRVRCSAWITSGPSVAATMPGPRWHGDTDELRRRRRTGAGHGRCRGHGQRAAAPARRRARRTPPRSTGCATTGSPAQGGLRRGRVRRLLGAWSPGPGIDAPRTEWIAVNACLVPAPPSTARRSSPPRGSARPSALHPVQREMAVRGGSQCGYCTPGFVCSMAAEYYRPDRGRRRRNARATREHGPNGFDLHALSGNLCRCTGYRPIRDAAYALGAPAADDPLAARCAQPAPRGRTRPGCGPTAASSSGPPTWPRRCALLAEHARRRPSSPAAPTGASRSTCAAPRAASCVAIDRLPELRELDVGRRTVEIGAALTLTEIERRLDGRVPLLDRAVPAVRLPADPQRRHARRQPRHRLAHRRHPAGAARARRDAACSPRADGEREVRAGRLLHRLPAERAAARTS